MSVSGRTAWTSLTEGQLLAQCDVDTYRASGPGGQKRNKTSSAVRLRHRPSGLIVIAEESRSQHENKARALRRLRKELYLHLRELTPAGRALLPPEVHTVVSAGGKVHLNAKNPLYWETIGVVFDVLAAADGRVSEAAERIGISTGNLIDLLEQDPKVWQYANQMRCKFGHKPLK